jgi:hypothetical protein
MDMTYEVKYTAIEKSGRTVEESKLTDSYPEMTNRNGLDAIKFIVKGKTRFTWFEIPNDYQMNKYYERVEITVSEATTGKNIAKISREA